MTHFGLSEGTRIRIDLTDMRLVLSVVEHGSFTRGGHAMNLSLASVSERVGRMESVLGAPLFERGRRGVHPTAAGEALVRHARTILRQVEEMHGDLTTYAQGMRGRVRLLANTVSLVAYVPRRLRHFLEAHPGLSVDVEEKPSSEIVEALVHERAELGVATDATSLFALQTRFIADDRLVVAVGPKHRLAQCERVDFAELLDEPFVGLADAALEVHLAEHASRLGKQIQYRVKLRNLVDVGTMIESGIGLAILSAAYIDQLHNPDLCIVELDSPWARRRLYLCARDFDTLTPAAATLATYLSS